VRARWSGGGVTQRYAAALALVKVRKRSNNNWRQGPEAKRSNRNEGTRSVTPSASVVKLGGVPMAVAPWIVSDGLWSRIEPLLPRVKRRLRYPGRKRLPDRQALQGILFVLHTGIAWRHLPLELGFGSGSTCYRRLDEWQQAGVWEKLHVLLLAELRAAGELEWSRAVADSSHVQAKRGLRDGPEPG
jgi:transposase